MLAGCWAGTAAWLVRERCDAMSQQSLTAACIKRPSMISMQLCSQRRTLLFLKFSPTCRQFRLVCSGPSILAAVCITLPSTVEAAGRIPKHSRNATTDRNAGLEVFRERKPVLSAKSHKPSHH